MSDQKYRLFSLGDLNAFFGLLLDNMLNLVVLGGILIGGFGFPADIVYRKMIPGTAVGVMVGDLIYTWLAFRLARKSGKDTITAMPLGLDTPTTIGIAVTVLGPVYLETKDAITAWQVGMAVTIIMGLVKTGFAFFGDVVKRSLPTAALLGSIAGIGLVLLGYFPVTKIFAHPIVGFTTLVIVLCAFVGRLKIPFNIPGALLAVAVGTLLYYLLGAAGVAETKTPALVLFFALPLPTLGFAYGIPHSLGYLSMAIPFGLLTIVGGINVTESARLAGDDYRTRDILLTEAIATLVAGLCGGVVQSTPYIGHPAYKAMGARAGYTLLTALAVGIGGVLGLVSFVVDLLPEAAVTPILLFVGLEIMHQAFAETPKHHVKAIAFAMLPIVGYLALINYDTIGSALGSTPVPASVARDHDTIRAIGHGFILTAVLWGSMLVGIIDRRRRLFSVITLVAVILSLFGFIHSVLPSGGIYLPTSPSTTLHYQIAIGYLIVLGVGLGLMRGQPAAGAINP